MCSSTRSMHAAFETTTPSMTCMSVLAAAIAALLFNSSTALSISKPTTTPSPSPTGNSGRADSSWLCKKLTSLWDGSYCGSDPLQLRYLHTIRVAYGKDMTLPPSVKVCLYTNNGGPLTNVEVQRLQGTRVNSRQGSTVSVGIVTSTCTRNTALYAVTDEENRHLTTVAFVTFGVCENNTNRLHGAPRNPIAINIVIRSNKSERAAVIRAALEILRRRGMWSSAFDENGFLCGGFPKISMSWLLDSGFFFRLE